MKPLDLTAGCRALLCLAFPLWLAGLLNAPAGEHDRNANFSALLHSQARAQEVEPQVPDVAPPDEIKPSVSAPTFGLKPLYEVGEPIVVPLLLPEGQKLIDVEWELPLQYIEPPNSLDVIYPYPIGVGSWPIRANYIVDTGGKLSIKWLIETLNVGKAPDAKTLVELAGPQAEALGKVYAALATSSYTSLAHFHGVESAALADMSLANNPAVAAIADRLAKKIAPFDGPKLLTELKAIAGELGSKPTPDDPVDPTTKATAATYVYEKDDTAIPVGVSTGLNRLNREKGIRATLFEDDTVDGDGDVPDQYKAALDAAVKAGLPAFVVQSGDKVLTVVKAPTTETQLLEAVP